MNKRLFPHFFIYTTSILYSACFIFITWLCKSNKFALKYASFLTMHLLRYMYNVYSMGFSNIVSVSKICDLRKSQNVSLHWNEKIARFPTYDFGYNTEPNLKTSYTHSAQNLTLFLLNGVSFSVTRTVFELQAKNWKKVQKFNMFWLP